MFLFKKTLCFHLEFGTLILLLILLFISLILPSILPFIFPFACYSIRSDIKLPETHTNNLPGHKKTIVPFCRAFCSRFCPKRLVYYVSQSTNPLVTGSFTIQVLWPVRKNDPSSIPTRETLTDKRAIFKIRNENDVLLITVPSDTIFCALAKPFVFTTAIKKKNEQL
jgi:hypothetical protein